jgi:hypothetical protein
MLGKRLYFFAMFLLETILVEAVTQEVSWLNLCPAIQVQPLRCESRHSDSTHGDRCGHIRHFLQLFSACYEGAILA